MNANDLALATENEFAFLEGLGLPLVEWSEIFPESFKGGFKLLVELIRIVGHITSARSGLAGERPWASR